MTIERRDGTPAIPHPFMLRTRRGRWLASCPKHRLVFSNRELYEEHWTPECDGDVLPPSDHLRHVKGYKRIRRSQLNGYKRELLHQQQMLKTWKGRRR